MDLEKFLFVMDVTNIADLYSFYNECIEDIKKYLYGTINYASELNQYLNDLSSAENKKHIAGCMKNIDTCNFNFNTISIQAKVILKRIEYLKKLETLPVSI